MFLRLNKRSELPLAALVPNLLTTLALSCGLASIHFSSKAAYLMDHGALRDVYLPQWERALFAILLSAIFDALDGRAARLLRVTSKFGAVLDSLSDFLSFGVAPAIILHEWTLGSLINPQEGGRSIGGMFALIAVTTFAICSALRLARFTSATPPPAGAALKTSSAFFVGMPTPAAAGAVLVPAMLDASPMLNWPESWPKSALPWLVIAYTLLLAFLMISRIPMFSLKKIRVSRMVVAPLLVLVGILVVLMIFDPWLTISIIAVAYLCSLPAAVLLQRRQRTHPMPDQDLAPAH
jgi:CDP-diacylglycerol--serine O-phosphatidyltransferase